MEKLIYKKGHCLTEEMVIGILKNLTCTNIRNGNYNKSQSNYSYAGGGIKIYPDFLCNYNNCECAVEVGDLQDKDARINTMLNIWKYVIHIFPDTNILMLHTILYQRKEEQTRLVQEFIRKYKELIKEEE